MGTAVLRDGTVVRLRPLVSADRDWIMRGFPLLSEESRYNRFLAPMRELPAAALGRLVDAVDGERHVAIVMFQVPPEGPEAPIAVARFVRLATDPRTAEVAVTVIDRHQGKGAGSLLVDALVVHACRTGVRAFSATMTSANTASRRLLTRVGTAVHQESVGHGVTEVVVALRCPPDRCG